jgi:phage terminase large subunit-like protein
MSFLMQTSLLQSLPSGMPLDLLLATLEAEKDKRTRENRLKDYQPYAKQAEFHAAGARYRERLFMAGNQLGKTVAGSFEVALHLTGLYPDWWQGRRWDRPTKWWAAGVTGESTRDNPQRLLVGPPQDGSMRGTGAVPKAHLIDVTPARGIPDAIDSMLVRHQRGGHSTLLFKSYEKGREKWQGDTLDGVWFDEEPPLDIYTEGLTRTNATGGMVFMTFTPLLGVSDVVKRFLMEENPDRVVVQMTIEDAEHYTPEQRAQIIASYPEHEREARAKGIPILGSGRVFPVAEEKIKIDPMPIPQHWPQIGALDFGYDHPFGAVKTGLGS